MLAVQQLNSPAPGPRSPAGSPDKSVYTSLEAFGAALLEDRPALGKDGVARLLARLESDELGFLDARDVPTDVAELRSLGFNPGTATAMSRVLLSRFRRAR
jgi:hypothetical protein